MHAENVLEFEPLRDLVGRYVRSELGRAELAALAPSSDRTAIEAALGERASIRLSSIEQDQPFSFRAQDANFAAREDRMRRLERAIG